MNHNRDRAATPDAWEKHLRSISPPAPPDDLLPRCLATIDPAAIKAAAEQVSLLQETAAPRRDDRQALQRSRRKWVVSIVPLAAAILIGLVFFWSAHGTPNLLAEVVQALDRAAAYHVRATIRDPAMSEAIGSNTIEMWLVRGAGRRTENRLNEKLVSVLVENPRWKLLWDPSGRRVSAWPSELLDAKAQWPFEEFTVSREKIIDWAKKEKASVVPQAVELDGRKAEKVTLTWPAESPLGRLSIWFDPASQRPVKLFGEKLDSTPQFEATIDYPPPEAFQDRFVFRVPRDADVEVYDPQFDRELSSEGQTGPDLRPK